MADTTETEDTPLKLMRSEETLALLESWATKLTPTKEAEAEVMRREWAAEVSCNRTVEAVKEAVPCNAETVTEPLLERTLKSSRETKDMEPEEALMDMLDTLADKLSMLPDKLAPVELKDKEELRELSSRVTLDALNM